MTAPNFLFLSVSRLSAKVPPVGGRVPVVLAQVVARVVDRNWVPNWGTGSIAGTTKIYSVPTNISAPTRRVRLYDHDSGLLVRETTSDASGDYGFSNLLRTRTYYVTAFDHLTGYDAVIHDNLTPV